MRHSMVWSSYYLLVLSIFLKSLQNDLFYLQVPFRHGCRAPCWGTGPASSRWANQSTTTGSMGCHSSTASPSETVRNPGVQTTTRCFVCFFKKLVSLFQVRWPTGASFWRVKPTKRTARPTGLLSPSLGRWPIRIPAKTSSPGNGKKKKIKVDVSGLKSESKHW